MAHHHHHQEPQKIQSILDSLYCEEEETWVEDDDLFTEEVGESCVEDNKTTNSVFLFEHDLLWEEGELASLFTKETENVMCEMLKNQCLGSARREAVEWILKAIGFYSFSAQTAFLAVNYLDRFLLKSQAQSHKPWMNQLVAVACLSLAAKVEETEVPLLLDLQVEESRYVFESKTVQRMELLVLSTLEWKMNPVTPFSFLDYITRRLGLKNFLCLEFLRRCERVLLYTITDSRFMGYLPSTMACATMLHVIDRLEPYIGEKYQEQLLGIFEIVKDKVEDCYRLIKAVSSNIDFHSNKRKFVTLLPGSPTGVMDVSFSSDCSNDSWSVATSVSSSPEPLSKKTRSQEPRQGS